MKFRLTYDGSLPAAGRSNARVREKHAIRQQIHEQMSVLLQTHPALMNVSFLEIKASKAGRRNEPYLPRITVGEFEFIPFVCKQLGMVCELDILFLRPEPPGYIVSQGGDIDNRLKVLFDALRVPTSPKEIKSDSRVRGPGPIICLLEDDALITGFRVTTDRLLKRIDEADNHVRLVIEVTPRVTGGQLLGMHLGF